MATPAREERPQTGSTSAGCDVLIVFAGAPRVGSLGHAFQELGCNVEEIDVKRGGHLHDVRRQELRDMLVRGVRRKAYDVVWIATPCSSFSVLWQDGTQGRIRSRSSPEGVQPLPRRWRAYVRKHNEFVRLTAELAAAAHTAGTTYIIENPVDRGYVGSPHFGWKARGHVPLWLMPEIRQLSRSTRPKWLSFAQCAFGGDFQKWTTLMASGPRAHKLSGIGDLGCSHASHTRVAKGRDLSGNSEAEAAGEYPPLMCAAVAFLLHRDGQWSSREELQKAIASKEAGELCRQIERQRMLNERAASAFAGMRELAHDSQPDPLAAEDSASEVGVAQAASDGGSRAPGGWTAAPEAMPEDWPERCDILGGKSDEARQAALRYVSRRRAEPESDDLLMSECLPAPCPPPSLLPRTVGERMDWPEGAPPRPIGIDQLYLPGVYAEVKGAVAEIAADMARAEKSRVRGEQIEVIPRRETRVFTEESQPAWARQCVWDTSDPTDCVPLQPYDASDPPVQEARPEFFRRWGESLDWPDKDMLHRVCVTGCESRAVCARHTVIHSHHTGLRENYEPAAKAVASDAEKQWIRVGSPDLQTVPMRLIPKNVVKQGKWKIDDAGALYEAVKWRVTTDDSVIAMGSDSRNSALDKSEISNVSLPTVSKLARAVAIVRAQSAELGLQLPEKHLENVAVWALDLSDAYRRLAAARHEWWQQGFIWFDGVRLDTRCVFGSAHLVDLFQRVSSFVLAVAAVRVRSYERTHAYGGVRQRWQAARRARGRPDDCTFMDIYLDDGFGATCVDEGEPIRGVAGDGPQVRVELESSEDGIVRLVVHVNKSRPEIHLAIVRRTFNEAGWEIAVEKVQLGRELNILGLWLSTWGDGAIGVPEAKRRGMLAEILEQQAPHSRDGSVSREAVERLVGRASFVAQVAAEGNAYLQPMFRMQYAPSFRIRALQVAGQSSQKVRVKFRSRRLKVKGEGELQREYQEALDWWRAAFESGVSVPLAPRKVFPALSERGSVFAFTDAAREDGTGYGGFTVVRRQSGRTEFLYLAEQWREEPLRKLQADDMSMPAGEAYGAVMLIDAILSHLEGASHMTCFTDSDATAKALTSSNSGAPQLNLLMRWLVERHPHTQFLGVHQPGVRNGVSDRLSRGRAEEVLAEVRTAGLEPLHLRHVDHDSVVLSAVMRAPLRRSGKGRRSSAKRSRASATQV